MTEDEFAHAVRLLCQQFGGSVTSWGRTDAHSRSVGGFAGDPHTHWFGADVIWDSPQEFLVKVTAYQLGLCVLDEQTHVHLQPVSYPQGSLTAEQVEAWKGEGTST